MPISNYSTLGSGWGLPVLSGGQYDDPLNPNSGIPNAMAPIAMPSISKAMLDGTTDTNPGGGLGIYDTSGMANAITPDGSSGFDFGGLMKGMFGTKESPGWGGAAMGAAQGLFNGWLGMQQYGLAKDKLAESKRQFDLNYGAQKGLTNSQLEDRQRARVASNPGAYQSVGDYMNTYGIK